jgi:hypothetical protein
VKFRSSFFGSVGQTQQLQNLYIDLETLKSKAKEEREAGLAV